MKTEDSMRRLIAAAAFAAIALAGACGSSSAQDMDDYRWHNSRGLYPWTPSGDPSLSNCRIVDIQTTNRWGTDLTIHRRVCD
jgi:hypothetical protein